MEIRLTIKKAVDASPELRSKKALIESFISGVNDIDDVMDVWHDYVIEMKEKDLVIIIDQIFTYVKNKEYELREKDHTVSGMLLYAKTDEEIYSNNVYQMSGNQITVRTLDLNLPFDEIAGQLNTIAKTHFDL